MTMAHSKLTIFNYEDQLLAQVQRSEGRLYLLKLSVVDQCLITTKDNSEDRLWHSRYGHLNFHTLKELSRLKMVEGLPPIEVPDQLCRSCVAGKQHRSSFPKGSQFHASKLLELLYMDICAPISPSTLGRSRYFLLIVDDFSRLMWVSMLKSKSDAVTELKRFKALAEAEQDTRIKCLRSNRGGEFTSEAFTDFCIAHGVKRQLTAPYSPQENGVVERKNRTIMSLVCSMLKEKSLPRELWGEAVNTAVYLLNRSSTRSLQGGTLYEAWTGRKPSIAHLQVFGSIVHVKCTKTPQKKLEDHSMPMVFLGYEVGTKAYRCFNPINAIVHISRDVLFEEDGKWDWTNHSEGISTLTFNPGLYVESISEDSSHPERDRDEDHEENSVEATSPQSESHEPEPLRFKSITQLYFETDPM